MAKRAVAPGAAALANLIGIGTDQPALEMASVLLAKFGTVGGVLWASRRRLSATLPDCEVAVQTIVAARDLLRIALASELLDRPIISSMDALRDHLFAEMAFELNEQIRVLFLDTRNRLLREEIVALGGVSFANVSLREIMRLAFDHNACACIVVHNHPSGDPRPTKADIDWTLGLVRAARLLDITVLDHIVIARSGMTSLRNEGLM